MKSKLKSALETKKNSSAESEKKKELNKLDRYIKKII